MLSVSTEKKAVNVGTFFFGYFQGFLFVFHRFYFDTSGCRSLYIHPIWNLLFFSWIYRMFFIRFGKISAITSLSIISASPLSPPPLLVLPLPYILVYFLVSHISVSLFILSFSLCSSNYLISLTLSSSLAILLPTQIYCWAPLVNLSFRLLYLSTQISIWLLLNNLCPLIDILCRMGHCQHIFLSPLSLVSFSSSDIFIKAALKSLLNLTPGFFKCSFCCLLFFLM